MPIRVGINGFGRIGRSILRANRGLSELEFVAVNDLTNPEQLAVTLKYDSIHGVYEGKIRVDGDNIIIDGDIIRTFAERDPEKIPWGEMGVDAVVDSTGLFKSRDVLEKHLKAGAKKVVLAVPPKGEIDAIIVLGVNHHILTGEERIVSNASCTTNCAAPVVKVIHEKFGIRRGFLTTVHAYTNDQRLLDYPHRDMRRARAAALSIIPTTTGAAKTVEKIIPELAGRLEGMAYRVPVADGSVCDLMVELERETEPEEVNEAMHNAALGELKGILEYCTDPIVSVDIVGNPHSSIFDAELTQMLEGNLLKVSSWYDNEWGYSNRVLELVQKLFQMGS
ncbi:MAG: type I glyceraldehyde-3-phosphate dehydrogenase [Deltaproteobacteria bacterium]|nr:type I glyceraldehyde-3-phosphate dehydrogenase [Deltaproteobacteria bacterium]